MKERGAIKKKSRRDKENIVVRERKGRPDG
jgi:hypothetical protein